MRFEATDGWFIVSWFDTVEDRDMVAKFDDKTMAEEYMEYLQILGRAEKM